MQDFAGLRECRVHCTLWIFSTVAVILVWTKTINYRFQHVYQRLVLRIDTLVPDGYGLIHIRAISSLRAEVAF
jgi:predicted small integral membrane protein